MRRSRVSGFTLIEIMMVVLMLGVIAAIVIPHFAGGSPQKETRDAAFATSLRKMAQQFALYEQRAGAYPADRAPAEFPPEMAGLIAPGDWQRDTPLGGRWDWDRNVFGIAAGLSVFQPPQTDARMAEVDRMIDDGDLATGAFRRRVDGYVYVLRQ